MKEPSDDNASVIHVDYVLVSSHRNETLKIQTESHYKSRCALMNEPNTNIFLTPSS